MTQYEYKVLEDTNLTREKLEEVCNKLGEKGWRLSSIKEGYLIFEREIIQGI